MTKSPAQARADDRARMKEKGPAPAVRATKPYAPACPSA